MTKLATTRSSITQAEAIEIIRRACPKAGIRFELIDKLGLLQMASELTKHTWDEIPMEFRT